MTDKKKETIKADDMNSISFHSNETGMIGMLRQNHDGVWQPVPSGSVVKDISKLEEVQSAAQQVRGILSGAMHTHPLSFNSGTNANSISINSGTYVSHSSGGPFHLYDEQKADHPSFKPKSIPLEDYKGHLLDVVIVDKVKILFDDRPEEVSIRIEYGSSKINELHSWEIKTAMEHIQHITSHFRIEGCKRIELMIVQKEVIE